LVFRLGVAKRHQLLPLLIEFGRPRHEHREWYQGRRLAVLCNLGSPRPGSDAGKSRAWLVRVFGTANARRATGWLCRCRTKD
jgi:hypothetical protein